MAPSTTSSTSERVESLATSFVGALGLLDLILGSLTLYWARLWSGPEIAKLFPSTGFPFVDVALLACAAALVGKPSFS